MEQVEEQQAWPARAAQVCRTHPAILANIPLGSTQASQVSKQRISVALELEHVS